MACRNIIFSSITIIIIYLVSGVSAEYIEGIDTTDVNGSCRDSSFFITPYGNIEGTQIVKYYVKSDYGYFNYTFDEIKVVPQIPDKIDYTKESYYCFAVKKKNGTYMKVQFQEKLNDGRYIYKYGTNTVPGERVLEKQDYDRSIRYKPNNLHYFIAYPTGFITITWDPPLVNNNHLTGYVLYFSKWNESIDTSAPINFTQWDSITIADTTTKLVISSMGRDYYNLVAVYTEGKSDFLKGWSIMTCTYVNAKPEMVLVPMLQNDLILQQTSSGYNLTFTSPLKQLPPLSIVLYNAAGRFITSFSAKNGEPVYFNPQGHNVAGGMYIVKAMAGKEVLAKQTFTIVR